MEHRIEVRTADLVAAFTSSSIRRLRRYSGFE